MAAELSDLKAPENRFERDQGRLLEVYLPVPTPGGQPLLFETYSRYSSASFSDQEQVLDAVDAAAVGYLLKDADPDALRGGGT